MAGVMSVIHGRCRDSMMLSLGSSVFSNTWKPGDFDLFKTTSAFSAPGANEKFYVEGKSRHAYGTEMLFFFSA